MDSLFDDILQLPDVPRPLVLQEELFHLRVHGDLPQPQLLGKALEEVAGQEEHILAPLPQGGYGQVDYIEAVIEIEAEMPLLHQAGYIPVGGGNDPDLHRNGRVAPDAGYLPFLEDPKQTHLGLQGNVPDLI